MLNYSVAELRFKRTSSHMLRGFGNLELYVSTRANGRYIKAHQAQKIKERNKVHHSLYGKVSSQYLWHNCLSGTNHDAFALDSQLR